MTFLFKKKVKSSNLKNNRFKELNNLVDAVNAIFRNRQDYSENIFESIAWSINSLTGAKTIIIGKYHSDNNEIETLAFWDNGDIRKNYSYPLKNTPCETIIGQQPCSYPVNVSKMFPLDKGLAKRNIEAYVGIPLYYSENKPMGLLAAMFDFELPEFLIVESLLQIFGIRVGSEIGHLEYHTLLENQNNELNSLFIKLKEKNKELDNYVSEVKKAHKETEESNQLKTAFLANLSHEIRTPMNVILGFSELLKSEHLSQDDRVEYIDIINQNGIQLLKIMDNLIDISKFQSKTKVQEAKPVKINGLLDRFFENYLDYLRVVQKPLKLYVEKGLSDKSDEIVSDQEGLCKILEQLLDNSVKFTQEGWIKFGYEIKNKSIIFFVKDTGIGIPEGMEEKIFDMFRQVDLRASREFGGNGLGLAIAKKYTELINGKLWTEKIKDCTTCFYLEIPYVRANS